MKITKQDHVLGNKNAVIELIEYADYQCPYCQKAYYILKDVEQQLGENVRFVFRNFPLIELHPYALQAAVAAETAGEQGKFWEMHDLLFENQESLEEEYLMEYAQKLDLDMEKFEKDFGKDQAVQKIKDDYSSGLRHNVEGTPTFFINGEVFQGNWAGREFIDYMRSLI